MILTPSDFTYEYLGSLKFKELQKLSVQYHVNKRWAKKQELIENLLALKERNATAIVDKPEENEWKDGSTVFSDSKLSNESNVDRRLTFSVSSKSNTGHTDPHLTFEVPQNGNNLLKEAVNSRETYDIPPAKTDFSVEPLLDSRATFDVPPKKLMEDIDPRATFEISQKPGKLLEENSLNVNSNLGYQNLNERFSKSNTDMNLKQINNIGLKHDSGKKKINDVDLNNKERKSGKAKPQVKMLTIPYARVTRRTKLNEAAISDKTPIKMSKKSINIKKSTKIPVSKGDLLKSPSFTSVKKMNKQIIIQSLTKSLPGKIIQSKVPVRLQFTEEKPNLPEKKGSVGKENVNKNQGKRISKTANDVFKKKSNVAKVNFKTPPPPSLTKTSRSVPLKKIVLKKDTNEKLNSSVTPTPDKLLNKPIVTTKMPDFSKIHKKQFEQMDSLHDYLKKKEERIKKLFGTPQPGQQLQTLNKSASVFHFRSLATDKGDKERKTPLKNKDNNSKTAQKETIKSKLPPSNLRTDIKDKNRSHIHGVRTNKRFELQMKFRNI